MGRDPAWYSPAVAFLNALFASVERSIRCGCRVGKSLARCLTHQSSCRSDLPTRWQLLQIRQDAWARREDAPLRTHAAVVLAVHRVSTSPDRNIRPGRSRASRTTCGLSRRGRSRAWCSPPRHRIFDHLAGRRIEAADHVHPFRRVPDLVLGIDAERVGRRLRPGQRNSLKRSSFGSNCPILPAWNSANQTMPSSTSRCGAGSRSCVGG